MLVQALINRVFVGEPEEADWRELASFFGVKPEEKEATIQAIARELDRLGIYVPPNKYQG